ncbi:hypothetical protein AAFF_G00278820 [Aldrovandia affinis]|uniref:Probable G-protein coupled receptor 34 n=1 Tax=Aldrovandia affinis TaxID=143900 RepID=A0AAD7WSE9_9TELE|nr:hypothetical protein AAFF_G00278820 [Aldrovandia affinis]
MTSLLTTSLPNVSYVAGLHPPGGNTCRVDDMALSIPLAFCYSVFFVFGLAGNLLALWVFLFVQGKKSSVRVLLVNVAVADLLLVVCLPFRVLYHSRGNRWTLGPTFCKVVGNVFYMNMYISITILGLISVDRYFKVHRTGVAGCRKSSWSVVACAMIWALSVTVTILMVISSDGSEDAGKCFHYKKKLGAEWKAYLNYFLVAVFWVVFLALVVSYGKIALKLLGTSREKPGFPNAHRYSRTAKKSFFVLFLFTVCFVPYHSFRIVYIHSQIHKTTCSWASLLDRINEVVLLFSTLNSCLDPIMYFLLSGSVRRATLRILNNFFCQQADGATSSSESHMPSVITIGSTPRPSAALITPLRSITTDQSNLLQAKLAEGTSCPQATHRKQ